MTYVDATQTSTVCTDDIATIRGKKDGISEYTSGSDKKYENNVKTIYSIYVFM